MKKIFIYSFLFTILSLTTIPLVQAEDGNWINFAEKFKNGEIELNCRSITCAARWGANRHKLKQLESDNDWYGLAEKTAELNQNGLLAYYYLAEAAIELGFYDAADSYMDKSNGKDVDQSCIFGTCEGINIQQVFYQFRWRIDESRKN